MKLIPHHILLLIYSLKIATSKLTTLVIKISSLTKSLRR
nr:MAG TPA: hypothetical protein [Crassvirales sp.]